MKEKSLAIWPAETIAAIADHIVKGVGDIVNRDPDREVNEYSKKHRRFNANGGTYNASINEEKRMARAAQKEFREMQVRSTAWHAPKRKCSFMVDLMADRRLRQRGPQ